MESIEKLELMRNRKLVSLESLGLCEHCGIPLSDEDMPADAMEADWRCPSCEGLLTNKTFGFEEIEGEWKRTRWVGPEKKWVEERPTDDFALGSWYVLITRSLDPRY